jgi:opacity protein-like surface antigen
MKKILAAIVSVALLGGVSLADDVKRSSHTATADILQIIPGATAGKTFVGVVVSSPSTTGGITVYDSNGSAASNVITNVRCSSVQAPMYELRVSSGISYVSSGACSSGVTIIWK